MSFILYTSSIYPIKSQSSKSNIQDFLRLKDMLNLNIPQESNQNRIPRGQIRENKDKACLLRRVIVLSIHTTDNREEGRKIVL